MGLEGEAMNSVVMSSIVFVCVFGGALFGIFLHDTLPQNHFTADSKEVIKLGMGLVATMSALVLGLLVASAKNLYDAQSGALTSMSARVVLLDRILAHYGPETTEARTLLRGFVAVILDRMWPKGRASRSQLEPPSADSEIIMDKIQKLSPVDDAQHSRKSQALDILLGLAQTRWLWFTQGVTSISLPMLAMLVFWLATLFVSFGLLAPSNATVVGSLLVSAMSVSGAIFLILELYTPYKGVIQISSAPLRAALAQLGK